MKTSLIGKAVRYVAAAGVISVVAAGLTATAAYGDPPPPVLPTPVSAKALPTWQINGVAWSQAIVGNTVYVTGAFTKARPPGAPVGGAGEVDALNIFAYNLTTGERVASFSHSLNAQGLVVRAAPDGSRIYVGGDFTMVDGAAHGHVVAFNTSDGSRVASWNPNVEGQVRGLGITADTVYVGGNFGSANGQIRGSLAAFNVADRNITPWAPAVGGTGGYVWSMTMAPDNSRVIVGGSFSTLNGQSAYGMGSLDAATGAVLPWAANERIRTGGLNGAITSLKTDGVQVYGSGYAFGAGAAFEGTFAADPNTGTINWVNDCLGDTYDTFPLGLTLYAVGHVHNCTVVGGFPDTSPRVRWQKAIAGPTFPTGTITSKDAYGWDYRGLPYAGLLHWYPDLEFGTATPERQAAWSVTGSGDYVALAGEFPMVNGVAQQGLTRFTYRTTAGTSQKPLFSAALTPTATSTESGDVRVRWQSTWDRDDKSVTYDVYRDNGPSIATFTQDSVFYNLPSMGFIDTGRTLGAVHTYKVRAKDSDGNVQWSSASAPVTVGTAAVAAYTQAIRADGAMHLWRLRDTGPGFVDSIGFADGTSANVAFAAAGAVPGDSAVTAAGGSSPKLYVPATAAHPSAVTLEAWIKTTTGSGGRIIGFGDSASGTSSTGANDMVLYLANSGRVNFALNNGGWRGVQSARAVNDGQWHHVAATADGSGVSLFVDGKRVGRDQSPVTMAAFLGYWRLLADQTSGLPNRPSSAGLAGSLDEVAVYPTALSQAQVQAHYLASDRSGTWSSTPADSYGAAVAASGPDLFWRLAEPSGSTAVDSSTSGQDGAINGGVTFNQIGAVSDNTAIYFNGSNALVVDKETWNNPTAYSAELWFKTTSTVGGKLIGFGNAASGLSTSYDRHVCLLNSGKLQFGTYSGGQFKAETNGSYNDGQWHHLVASQGPDGMKLYVDSVLVATNPNTATQSYVGYWRVGGDRCWGGTSSNYVNGTLDEAAVYARVLTQDEVDQHYAASGRQLPNKLPTAAFTHAEHFTDITVDGTTSSDRDGTLVGYEWTFGDGATGSGATATHSYAAAGTYPVSLTVTDDRGGQATTSQLLTVVPNVGPTAAFTEEANYLALSVNGSGSSDPDGTLVDYAWSFGDGSTGTGATASHTFAAAGTYEVSLTVTDDFGATSTTSTSVTVVANALPTAAFSHTEAFLATSVDASASTDPEGPMAAYAWDFGDGATGAGATATHTYAAEGSYTVTLTVTDGAGATVTQSETVTVLAPPNELPAASFTTSESFLVVSVDGSGSSDPDGTIQSYAWDFGDGAVGTGATSSHTYEAPGTFTVTLTVTDNRGGNATTSQTVTVVANQIPTASFSHSETFLVLNVDGTGSSDPDGPLASYAWDFGDGTAGSSLTDSHTYAAAGTYTVVLTVTDGAGATATTSETVTVAANPAYASDSFARTVANGWGTADIGGAWTVSGTTSRYSVASGTAKVSLGTGTSATASLPGVSSTNTEVDVVVGTDRAPTGGGQFVSVIGRSTSATADYRAKLKLAAGGAVTVWLTRNVSGTETVLSTVSVPGLTYQVGDQLRIRLQVNGVSPTTLSVKVWKVGTAEPTGWQLTGADSSAVLQMGGSVGLYGYVSGSATNAPVNYSFGQLWVGPARP